MKTIRQIDAAKILGVTKQAISQMIRSGTLTATPDPRPILVAAAEVEKLRKSRLAKREKPIQS